MTSAPPAMPHQQAIQPASRPMTSQTMTRSCDSAVECRRSIASVAICTAVWKPNVKSVALRSLSIVLGTPTVGKPASNSLRATPSVSSPPIGISTSMPRSFERREHPLLAVLGLVDVRPRGAEDRAALVQDAARVRARQLDRVVLEHALPALAKAEDLVPVVVDPLADDSADDGVEAGTVAAACQKSDSCHAGHPATQVASTVGTLATASGRAAAPSAPVSPPAPRGRIRRGCRLHPCMRGQGDTLARLAWIAGRQHGRVARRQLLDAGVDHRQIDRWVADRRLLSVHRGVYAVGHRAPSALADYMAAVLAAGRGAVLSHRSAAWVLGLIAGRSPQPEVTVPTTADRGRPGIVIQPGLPKLRDALGADVRLSKLEDAFVVLLARNGLPLPRTNIDRHGDKVDCHWPERGLTVELVSYRYHGTRRAFEQDVARRRRSGHLAFRLRRRHRTRAGHDRRAACPVIRPGS